MIQITLLLAFIVPAIFFLISQQNTLQVIQLENRLMAPGLVWLQCIPLFGLIWQFFVVSRISNSISQEFASWESDSGLPSPEVASEFGKRPTYNIGIAYCIIITVGIIINFFALSPSVLTIVAVWNLCGAVCWVIYWVKLVQYKRKLQRRYL